MTNLSAEHPGARAGFTVGSQAEAIEAMFNAGLTDGLPVTPPTPELVTAMVAGGPWSADEILLHEVTRDTSITVYQAAVCAVMAGAKPEYFPVIGAALQAMSTTEFFLHGPTTSTGGAAIMIVVSGPIAGQIDLHGRENLFGPGFRANATIGRATRLAQIHCLGATPGELDKSTQGWAGKYSLCFTENVAESPWPPIHEALGNDPSTSTVTIFAAESGHNIVNHGASDPEALLLNFADSMAALGSFSPGRSVVVFSPEHAAKLSGWSRQRVQQFLFDHAVRDLATLKRTGKIEDNPGAERDWTGKWLPSGDLTIQPGDDQIMVHRGWSPEDIVLLVGGGTAGGHSMFFPSWSRGRSVPFVTVQIPT